MLRNVTGGRGPKPVSSRKGGALTAHSRLLQAPPRPLHPHGYLGPILSGAVCSPGKVCCRARLSEENIPSYPGSWASLCGLWNSWGGKDVHKESPLLSWDTSTLWQMVCHLISLDLHFHSPEATPWLSGILRNTQEVLNLEGVPCPCPGNMSFLPGWQLVQQRLGIAFRFNCFAIKMKQEFCCLQNNSHLLMYCES